MKIKFYISVFFIGLLFACTSSYKWLPSDVHTAYQKINFIPDYNQHIKPILSDRCFLCHGSDIHSRKANLNLSNRDEALAILKNSKNKHAIVPNDAKKSELVNRILSEDEYVHMPPPESHRRLSVDDKAMLIKWIETGATYKPHWAFTTPVKPNLPRIKSNPWCKNEIDLFVLSKLHEKNWQPQAEADKATLIRRVYMDLTGIPPTKEQTTAFILDRSPDAYEKILNQLLSDKAYGEQMAVQWMDLARYADTHGYTVDNYRAAWPWRDWVIKAFNHNMPYDQFVTWQLAGDLLPNATKEQRLATTFNRLHSQNAEGGIVNEEFRVEYVMDRTNTFGTAFLGLTVECARCHDHKFDPISQKDYYQLYSYFNNIQEAGQISWDGAMPGPTMLLSNDQQDSLIAFLNQKIESKKTEIKEYKIQQIDQFKEWEKAHLNPENIDIHKNLVSYFSFDSVHAVGYVNSLDPADTLRYQNPATTLGVKGKAFVSNGDDPFLFEHTGVYDRDQPFSVSTWLEIPKGLEKGVVLFKGFGEILYNYRGWFLNIRDNQFELMMNHTWPYNGIRKISLDTIPRNQWFHLVITYDGSSTANGLKLYVNGKESKFNVEEDHLYKSILLENNGFPSRQPGIGFGADLRSFGIKGGAIDEFRVYDKEITLPLIHKLFSLYHYSSQEFREGWSDFYFKELDSTFNQKLKELQELNHTKNKTIDTIPDQMVMDEMDSLKPAYRLQRGLYTLPAERVYPRPPQQIFRSFTDQKQNRLTLAHWLFDPNHPLTARVLVNRLWQKFFGKGLVHTSENFGYQGSLPIHPELLDWLSTYLIDHRWDLKAIQKYMVMSATYRQSSKADSNQVRQDIENIYLARGPKKRLTAEMMRDAALSSSLLLNHTIGGPSVKPYQPDGLWSISGATYRRDSGDHLYRKSLYTFWKRTNPPPSMSVFDAPSRSYCVVRRSQTATPLQSLNILNDPQYIEAARALAFHCIQKNEDLKNTIHTIYQSLTCVEPNDRELKILQDLYDYTIQHLDEHDVQDSGFLTLGEKRYPDVDQKQLLAFTLVASTIMNSDAFQTLR